MWLNFALLLTAACLAKDASSKPSVARSTAKYIIVERPVENAGEPYEMTTANSREMPSWISPHDQVTDHWNFDRDFYGVAG